MKIRDKAVQRGRAADFVKLLEQFQAESAMHAVVTWSDEEKKRRFLYPGESAPRRPSTRIAKSLTRGRPGPIQSR